MTQNDLIREESKKPQFDRLGAFISAVLLTAVMLVCLFTTFAEATEPSDEQIVNAIYKAEGGSKAKYPYGIRSVRCETTSECKKICLNTVKNNRKRFAIYGHKEFSNFIEFLGSRYCPTKGRGLSKAEVRLNRYWIKNVKHFLQVKA